MSDQSVEKNEKMKYFLQTAILLAMLTQDLLATQLKGRVMHGMRPVEGAVIRVFHGYQNISGVLNAVSDNSGHFSLDVQKGLYFIEAEKTISGRQYKGFSGKNPVLISDSEYVGIKLFPVYPVKTSKAKGEDIAIQGTLLADGKPLRDAIVYLYLKPTDFKGMPYMYSTPSDVEGKFRIRSVLEGQYFIVARKKRNPVPLGPVEEGDSIGFLAHNPIQVKSGNVYTLMIPLFIKEKDEAPALTYGAGRYIISGKAVDEQGKPVAGVYAFAYLNKEMGHERPVSISKKTGSDGTFAVLLPEKGIYYIGVREQYGGTPVQNELYGMYEGNFDHHVNVSEQEVRVTITVKRILR